jgi:hypothetical protein
MHNVEVMTEDRVAAVLAVLLDSTEQRKLNDNPDSVDIWMLDFVHDSSLQQRLARRCAVLDANISIQYLGAKGH